MARVRSEAGAATIVVLALAFALVIAAWGSASVVGTIVAHRMAQNAADLAALAAAQDNAKGVDGCERAAEVARANRAQLVSCVVEGRSVVVEVAVETPLAGRDPVRARARAGPALE